jgi:hypothetical protein
VYPVAPVSPVAPVYPGSPFGPAGPAGSETHPTNASVANVAAMTSFEFIMVISSTLLDRTTQLVVTNWWWAVTRYDQFLAAMISCGRSGHGYCTVASAADL